MKTKSEFRANAIPPASMKPRASVTDNRAAAKPAANHTGGGATNSFRVNTNKTVAKD